jgi:hypothetical protein
MSQTMKEKKIHHRVEIPIRLGTKTFEKIYREEALLGLLSKPYLDMILGEANKIMCEAHIKKKDNDEVKLPRFLILMSIAAVLLGIAYVGLLIIAIIYSEESGQLIIIYFATICLLSSITIISLLSIYNYFRKDKMFKPIEDFIEDDLNFFFENINKRYEDILAFNYNPNRKAIFINTFKKSSIDNDDLVVSYTLRQTSMLHDATMQYDNSNISSNTRSNSYNKVPVENSSKSIM